MPQNYVTRHIDNIIVTYTWKERKRLGLTESNLGNFNKILNKCCFFAIFAFFHAFQTKTTELEHQFCFKILFVFLQHFLAILILFYLKIPSFIKRTFYLSFLIQKIFLFFALIITLEFLILIKGDYSSTLSLFG